MVAWGTLVVLFMQFGCSKDRLASVLLEMYTTGPV